MAIQSLWEKICQDLKTEISTIFYNTWIHPIEPIYMDKEKFVLAAPNQFIKNYILNHYFDLIHDHLRKQTHETIELIVIEPTSEDFEYYKNEEKKEPIQINIEKETPLPPGLNDRYTFSNFVRGKSNELAYAGSLAVSEQPGRAYNPLFIYGGVGLGKTHLMNACALRIKQNFPHLKVVYTSSEKFTNEMIASIRQGENEKFRNKYRNIDVLVVDDIQFIAGKVGTQEEFFHTFNELYTANKQIIISSDKPPHLINSLEDRLRSRFEMGLITDISSPDYETRLAILQEKTKQQHVKAPVEVLAYIAEHVTSNIRELEGALTKVIVSCKVQNIPISLDAATEALENSLGIAQKEPITLEKIIEMVAREYKIQEGDIYSKNRSKRIAYPRQIAMYLSRELTDLSLLKIATQFEKDHSTVLYGIDKIRKDMESDPAFAQEVALLRGKVENNG